MLLYITVVLLLAYLACYHRCTGVGDIPQVALAIIMWPVVAAMLLAPFVYKSHRRPK